MVPLRSLRSRLVLPLLLASIVAATLVATVSYALAARTANQQLEQRFAAIERAIQRSRFPLSRNVLLSLSELTSAQWITLDAGGQIIDSTLELPGLNPAALAQRLAALPMHDESGSVDRESLTAPRSPPTRFPLAQRVYQAKRFRRSPAVGAGAAVQDIVVLFDDAQWRGARMQAAAAPLLTGLSTIVLLSSITLLLTGRLIRRLTRLQREVDAIASGDFSSDLELGPDDEIGRLGKAVESMAAQLRQMWQALGQQHGQRLLHQIAGGLAHNLRNSLTGARMAVELHARRCHASEPGDDGLKVAIDQLEQTEDYVHRLLLVSSGKQEQDRPAEVAQCLRDIRDSLSNTARHRAVTLHWNIDDRAGAQQVADGPTLTAAVTNLIWNAIQAGNQVTVDVKLLEPSSAIQIDVTDNGAGPPAEIAEILFDPFVTSKPEGLGLGLPVVKRSAEALRGTVQWRRHANRTIFSLRIPVRA
jgi:signal transduction histidine kinase